MKFICGLGAMLCGLCLFGQDLPVFIDEVVVEGEAVRDTATVETVTAQAIRDQGARTVAEALELVPGVYMSVGGKGEANFTLRGFSQRETAVLINGIPIAGPYEGTVDLANLPVETIERIEVVKGAASLLYGPNAMGGVVNIITRKGDGTRKGTAMGEWGTGDAGRAGVSFQGGAGKIRYLVAADYHRQDAYPLSGDYDSQSNQPEGDRSNSDREGWNAQASAGWDTGEDGRMTVSFNHIEQEKGIPHHESDPKAKYWRFTDWTRSLVDAVWEQSFGAAEFKAKAYYDLYENSLDSYDDATYSTQDSPKNGWTSSYDDDAAGVDLTLRFGRTDDLKWRLGLQMRRDIHRDQADAGEPWVRNEADVFSLPVEGEWRPSQKWALVYGASYDLMKFDTEEAGANEDTDAVNGQVAALCGLNDALQLRFSAARRTRFAALKELFSSTSGNPDLKPMTTNAYEVGLDAKASETLLLTAAVFYNDVQDLIDRAGKNDPYMNIDSAELSGVELTARWELHPRATLFMAYSYLDAKDTSGDEAVDLAYRPEHKVDLAANVRLPHAFDIGLTYGYISSQVTASDEVPELDSYQLVGLRISKALVQGLELYVNLHNLLDELYYESEGYPLGGRTLSGGLRWAF